jgi:hypothetical protein
MVLELYHKYIVCPWLWLIPVRRMKLVKNTGYGESFWPLSQYYVFVHCLIPPSEVPRNGGLN